MKPSVSRITIVLFGLLALLALIATLSLTAFVLAPRFIKPLLVQTLEHKLHRQVSIRSLRLNPLRMSLRIDGLRVQEAQSTAALLDVPQIYLRLGASSLWHGAPVITTLNISNPTLHVIRDGDQHFNLSDIIAEFNKPTPQPTPFVLENLQLVQGRIDIDDRITQHPQHIRQLQVNLPWLSKRARDRNLPIQVEVSLWLNGAPIQLSAIARPFAPTPSGSAHLNIHQLAVQPLLVYLPAALPFHVRAGQLDSALTVQASLPKNSTPSVRLAGVFDARQLALIPAQGSPIPLVELGDVQANIAQADILQQQWQLHSLTLDAPHLHLLRDAQARWEAEKMLPEHHDTPAHGTPAVMHPLRLSIDQVKLSHGNLDISQVGVPASADIHLHDIAFNAQHVSNLPGNWTRLALNLSTDHQASMSANAQFRLSPLQLDGHIEVHNFEPATYTPWLATFLPATTLPVTLQSGTVQISGHYRYDHALQLDQMAADVRNWHMSLSQGTHAQFTIDAMSLNGGLLNLSTHNAGLSSLDIRQSRVQFPRHTHPALDIAQCSVQQAHVDLTRHQFDLANVQSHDGTLRLQQDHNGNIALASLWTTTNHKKTTHTVRHHPAQASSKTSTQPVWSWHIDHLAVQNYAVVLHDHTSLQTTSRQHTLTVHDIQFAAQHLSSAPRQITPFQLQAKLNAGGKLGIQGTLQPTPFQLTSQISLQQLPLVPLQDFFSPYIRFTVTNGNVSTQGNFSVTSLSPLQTHFSGKARIDHFGAMTQNTARNFLNWQSLAFQNIQASTGASNNLSIQNIVLNKSFVRFIINPDGSFNLGKLFNLPKSSGQPSKTHLQIGRITLQNSNVSFHDNYIRPNYSAYVAQLSGTVSKLDSGQHRRASLQLTGQVNQQAGVTIDGQVDPFHNDPYLDILARLNDFELTPLSPYADRFTGYGIRKGKLSFNVHYHVEHHQLTAVNHLSLNQLSFGHKINSPNATHLPILLAVALLKDHNGNINVDLPVSGSLNDPQFSMGNIIFKALTNLIIKTVSAPFTLLANLFSDTDAQKMRHIDFASGSAALSPESITRLQKISLALTKRPELSLDIRGMSDSARDIDGLKQQALQRMVVDEKRRQLIANGQSAQAVTVSASEYSNYLTAAYRRDPIPNKPKNFLRLYKSLPVADMEQRMRTYINISSNNLNRLANQRAYAVETYLQQTLHVSSDRLYLLAPTVTTSANTPQNEVEFTLDAQ